LRVARKQTSQLVTGRTSELHASHGVPRQRTRLGATRNRARDTVDASKLSLHTSVECGLVRGRRTALGTCDLLRALGYRKHGCRVADADRLADRRRHIAAASAAIPTGRRVVAAIAQQHERTVASRHKQCIRLHIARRALQRVLGARRPSRCGRGEHERTTHGR
jgi:hypothetical protein